ncbi:MAG: helix-turn-helix transcriptional regulator [Clostridia bacterium]|nr:helix-turn-helix transcriptional regulator [Clostridia bacterium]
MNRPLNENIKLLRVQHHLSQVDVAKRLSVSKQCVSNWENDNVLPSIDMLGKLADLFGVSTDFLLGRSCELSLDATGLTEVQIAHIREIINDLKML